MRPIDTRGISRQQALVLTAFSSLPAFHVAPASSAEPQVPASIKARLDAQDARLLLKPTNGALLPPPEAEYPAWLEGEWSAAQSFAGYELPAKDVISRDALFAEADVPGFKKCSIALLPDVGKEGVQLRLRWVRDASGVIREDRAANLRSSMRAGLGYDAIERVDYKDDPNNRFGLGSNAGNPNRLKLVFAPGLTTNADRIEIFCNARETERASEDLFYIDEAVRQVTFSGTSSRQVNGEYCHFISYRRVTPSQVDAVILTAAYADPLGTERLFVKVGGVRPLIIFSHRLRMQKVQSAEV